MSSAHSQVGGGLDPAPPENRFRELADEWKRESMSSSSAVQIAMHPAYQQIIGMGPTALPLLLNELRNDPDHWFWALGADSGADPVPPESRGRIGELAEAWLEWGRKEGHVAQSNA